MKLIFLPGNSPATKAWAVSICRRLEKHITGFEVQDYLHWQQGKPNIDVAAEVQCFQKVIAKESGPYVVIAKSAGVVVCTRAYADLKLSPKAVVFIGSPLRSGSTRSANIVSLMTRIQQPVLLIQETADPICPFEALAVQLEPVKPDYFTLEEVPGNDHAYKDTEGVCSLIEKWWRDIGLIKDTQKI